MEKLAEVGNVVVVPPFETLKGLGSGKFTLVKYGEFGFLQAVKLNLVEVRVERWAQYPETVLLVGRPFGKRSLIGIRIKPQDRFAIWIGFLEVRTSMWVENERGDGVTIKKSLLSFDDEYLRMALDSVKEAPLAVKTNYGE